MSTTSYYACEHQSSNTPCSICQPGQPVMPDDWVDTYVPPSDQPGLTDSIDAAAKPTK